LLTLLFLSLPFVTHPSPPNIYPLSLHDALPICSLGSCRRLLLEFCGESSLSRGFFQRLANHAVNGTRDDPGQVTLEAVRARSKPPLGCIHGDGTSHVTAMSSSKDPHRFVLEPRPTTNSEREQRTLPVDLVGTRRLGYARHHVVAQRCDAAEPIPPRSG